jgi:hypothetical protein
MVYGKAAIGVLIIAGSNIGGTIDAIVSRLYSVAP